MQKNCFQVVDVIQFTSQLQREDRLPFILHGFFFTIIIIIIFILSSIAFSFSASLRQFLLLNNLLSSININRCLKFEGRKKIEAQFLRERIALEILPSGSTRLLKLYFYWFLKNITTFKQVD